MFAIHPAFKGTRRVNHVICEVFSRDPGKGTNAMARIGVRVRNGVRLVHALTRYRKSPKVSGGVVFSGRAPGLKSINDIWNSRTGGTSGWSTKRSSRSRFWVQESRRPTDESTGC